MLVWLQSNWVAVLGVVYVVINEIIALAPGLKSNSVVQLIVNLIGSLLPKQVPPAP